MKDLSNEELVYALMAEQWEAGYNGDPRESHFFDELLFRLSAGEEAVKKVTELEKEIKKWEDSRDGVLLSSQTKNYKIMELEKEVERLKCCGNCKYFSKLTEFSHTECLQCGAKNCQVVDYDNPEIDDLIVTGMAISKDGKRIDPRDLYQDRELLCREFTELTGGHWHKSNPATESCSTCGNVFGAFDGEINPTYTNPADVLRVMMKRDDCDDFLRELQKNHWLEIEEFIEKYIIEPDALLKAAVEFLKEERK